MRILLIILSFSYFCFGFGQSHQFCKYIGKKAKVFLKDVEANEEIHPYLFRHSRFGYSIHFEFQDNHYFLLVDRNSGKLPRSFYEGHKPIAAHFLSDFKIIQIEFGKENRFEREFLCGLDEEDSTHITIQLINSYTKKPIPNKKVIQPTEKYSNNGLGVWTDSLGFATLKVKWDFYIQIHADETEFVRKRILLDSTGLKKDAIKFYVRPNKTAKEIPDLTKEEMLGKKANWIRKYYKLRIDDIHASGHMPGKYARLIFYSRNGVEIAIYPRINRYFYLSDITRSNKRHVTLKRLKRKMLNYKVDRVEIFNTKE